jgi:hypothetical protein
MGNLLRKRRIVLAGTVVGGVIAWSVAATAGGGQIVTARPESLRFQLIGNEPIAGPDGRAVVAGWAVLMFKDRTTQQCYAVLREGPALAGTQEVRCP